MSTRELPDPRLEHGTVILRGEVRAAVRDPKTGWIWKIGQLDDGYIGYQVGSKVAATWHSSNS